MIIDWQYITMPFPPIVMVWKKSVAKKPNISKTELDQSANNKPDITEKNCQPEKVEFEFNLEEQDHSMIGQI